MGGRPTRTAAPRRAAPPRPRGAGTPVATGRPPASPREQAAVPVPAALLAEGPPSQLVQVAVLGAGCAGLSLCLQLVRRGERRPIVLIDRRTAYRDDRTWCFWDVEPAGAARLSRTCWPTWDVRTAGRTATSSAPATPYRSVRAADFYRDALAELARYPNVSLLLGAAVDAVDEQPDGVLAHTSLGGVTARTVVDSRGLPSLTEHSPADPPLVRQHFLGQRIRTARDVFDPSRCLLMDFRVDQTRGVHFVYLLPTSSREALVENVYFGSGAVGAAQHRHEIASYLRATLGVGTEELAVLAEEHGLIPMTMRRFGPHRPGRVGAIGLAGGAARPSTGYAFLRIQRSAAHIADALIRDQPVPVLRDPWRRRLLDGLFLRFLVRWPERCPEIYLRMFSRVPAPVLVRFLSDHSSPLDDLRIIAALPKRPFLVLLARAALDRVRHAR